MRWWVFVVMVGVSLFLLGTSVWTVPFLALCGIPLGLLGLAIAFVGMLAADGEASTAGAEAVVGAVLLAMGMGLVVFASVTGLGPASDWVLAQQRGAAVVWPMDATLAMLAWSAMASMMGAGAAQLRGLGMTLTLGFGAMLLLLAPMSVAAFLAMMIAFRMPLTA